MHRAVAACGLPASHLAGWREAVRPLEAVFPGYVRQRCCLHYKRRDGGCATTVHGDTARQLREGGGLKQEEGQQGVVTPRPLRLPRHLAALEGRLFMPCYCAAIPGANAFEQAL